MNFYIAHILDSSLDKINLYNVTDKNSSKKVLNSISDLEKISIIFRQTIRIDSKQF